MSSNFWRNMKEKSIEEYIDRQIGHLVVGTEKSYEEIYECERRTGDIYFDDLKFFLRKGIKFDYLNRIFSDLKKANAMHLPAMSADDNFSSNISLYEHAIKTAKSVFDTKEYSHSKRCNLALLLLIRETYKSQEILEMYHISMEDPTIYASHVITAYKDNDLLTAFRQYLYIHFLLTGTKKHEPR